MPKFFNSILYIYRALLWILAGIPGLKHCANLFVNLILCGTFPNLLLTIIGFSLANQLPISAHSRVFSNYFNTEFISLPNYPIYHHRYCILVLINLELLMV